MEAPVCCYVITLLFFLLQWVGTGLSQVAWTPIYVDGNSKWNVYSFQSAGYIYMCVSSSPYVCNQFNQLEV